MSHVHPDGRVCYLYGCTEGERVPVRCDLCEQTIGHAPKGGMAQASSTWDQIHFHLPECPGPIEV